MNTLTHICESYSTHGPCIRGNLSRESKQDAAAMRCRFAHRSYLDVARALFVKKKKKKKGKITRFAASISEYIFFFLEIYRPFSFLFSF